MNLHMLLEENLQQTSWMYSMVINMWTFPASCAYIDFKYLCIPISCSLWQTHKVIHFFEYLNLLA